jgi:hypothetical protein
MSVTVEQAGIDTWKPAWYVKEGSPAERAMRELATIPSARSRMIEDPLLGHRIGWHQGSRMVWAEGHPAEALGQDGLGAADDLPMALCALEQTLWDFGIPVEPKIARSAWGRVPMPQTADQLPGFAGIARLDATADLRFDTAAEGLAVLAGVAALPLPRMKTAFWREQGGPRIETVGFYGSTGKKMLGRWYDKGIESGTARRGTLIRPEDQRRFTRATRREVEELSSTYVQDKFKQRFMPLWQATKGITVAGTDVLAAKLLDLVESGEVTAGQAEQILGYAIFSRIGADEQLRPDKSRRTTAWRRKKALRDNGLVLADGSSPEVEVNLHDVLEQVLESDAWGAEG